MAKVILKTNLTNNNYTVEYKVINTPINKRVNIEFTELLISPKFGYTIRANEFTHGYLPSIISNIQYTNSGNNVIARVGFSSVVVNRDVLNISLPISTVAKTVENKFTLTDQTSTDTNVIVQSFSGGVVDSSSGSSATYNFIDKVGNVTVLRKIFSVPNGYYFKEEPSYNISSGGSGYKVTTNIKRDSHNNIVYKSFDVIYNFPKEILASKNTDTISFTAKSNAIETPLVDVVATKKEEYKIYSIDTGEKIGVQGGIKKIIVRGIPGTPFKILTQNTSKEVYDYKTGSFVAGSKFLAGVIPPARPGVGFGVFKTGIKVPASTAVNAITTRLITDAPITTVQGATGTTSTTQVGGSVIVEETVDIQTSMTVELKETGESNFVINRYLLASDADTATLTDAQISAGYIVDGTYVIGPGTTSKTIDVWEETNPIVSYGGDTYSYYLFRISTDSDNEYIRIHRQPKFNPSGKFIAWDSYYSGDGTKLKSHNNAGTEITTDWDNIGVSTDVTAAATTKLGGWSLGSTDSPGIVATVVQSGDGIPCSDCETDTIISSYVDIYITISGTFGKYDINPELRLLNFLSIET